MTCVLVPFSWGTTAGDDDIFAATASDNLCFSESDQGPCANCSRMLLAEVTSRFCACSILLMMALHCRSCSVATSPLGAILA